MENSKHFYCLIYLSFALTTNVWAENLFEYKKHCSELSSEDSALTIKKSTLLKERKDIEQLLDKGLLSQDTAVYSACITEKLNFTQLIPSLMNAAEKFNEPALWKSLAVLSTGQEIKLVPHSLKWLKDNSENTLTKKILALQILEATNVKLPEKEIIQLFSDKAFEVREQTFEYFTKVFNLYITKEQETIFTKSLSSSPFQLRKRVLDFYHQMNSNDKIRFKGLLKLCAQDSSEQVRKACTQ